MNELIDECEVVSLVELSTIDSEAGCYS